MPLSSLIFVVILAVWAVYLVQHWVRRRDHLATARSVDRFSEAMRVLERRRALPRPDIADRAPASSAAPLLRPARPEVVVKRSQAPAPATARGTASAVAHGSTAVGPSRAFRRAKLLAQVRAGALIAASLVMVTLTLLVMLQVLEWAWSLVGIGILAATLAAVRWSVSRPRRSRAGSGTTRAAAQADLAAQAVAVTTTRTARRAVDLRADTPRVEPYDIDQVEAELHRAPASIEPSAPAARTVGQDSVRRADAPEGTWEPVPVPPPTYTLKARAVRGAPAPSTHQPASLAAELPSELPADGSAMALDEEFEVLPRVDRVG